MKAKINKSLFRWKNRVLAKWLQNVRDAKRVIALLVHNKIDLSPRHTRRQIAHIHTHIHTHTHTHTHKMQRMLAWTHGVAHIGSHIYADSSGMGCFATNVLSHSSKPVPELSTFPR